jgi:hypothetical protein
VAAPVDNHAVPLQQFKPGYLWVSDLSSQSWCEQQLYYKFTVPGIVEENPAMTKGTNLHLARGSTYYIFIRKYSHFLIRKYSCHM